MIKKIVGRIVDFSGKYPFLVLFVALCTIAGTWTYASKLDLRSDFLELLPRESKGFKAFEHQLGRVGGGATLLVIVESPERAANEKFIDDLSQKVNGAIESRKNCITACKEDGGCRAACGPDLIAYAETGTKDVRKFFQDNKWLYADTSDLESADETLDHQIAISSGLVSNLEGDDPDDEPAPKSVPKPAPKQGQVAPAPAGSTAPPPAPANPEKKAAFGMDEYRERWKDKANKHDDFPTGYFATPDGKSLGIRIISTTSGMGGRDGDLLLNQVRAMVGALNVTAYQPQMQVGYAGDIPNAIEEKDSLVSDAVWATGIAFVLILGGVVFFFRSPWSLAVIALPVFIGVGCAYSFAMATFGYVNTSGAFLAAIILGNGINYPIVLLSRYREFRARGQAPDDARRDAVWNAFRAELVGALVGGIAYGSLIVTRFRGFNQFGMIGFVGMLLVWVSMIPTVPAMLVVIEKVQAKLPWWLRDPPPRIEKDGSRGPVTKLIANATERYPWVFLSLAAVACVVAAWKLPTYLRDPWEYNFDHLGSRGSKVSGAGIWSNKAEKVFGGKMNIAGALMLADSPEQVPLIKQKIFDNDAHDPDGKLVAEVATVEDLLPGPDADQKRKLAVLDRIRDRLTPAVLHGLKNDEERKRVEEMRPPDDIKALTAKDLPGLLRRRFEENNGTVGTVFYVKFNNNVSFSDGHNLLRISKTTDNVVLPDGTQVQTASRSTIFAEMIHSMEHDGPLATVVSFSAVVVVVLLACSSLRGGLCVLAALLMGVLWTIGGAALIDMKLNFLNFIALPITFGIGCEYPFNIFDRSRLLGGDVTSAVKRTGGAVALCSYTTAIGYGSLLFADNQALQSFGRLAMSGEIACLVGALLVLPALLHVVMKRSGPPANEAKDVVIEGAPPSA